MNTANLHAPRARVRRVRLGLSLVEAMISLAIAAMLLTAVGVAFTSTARAMQINDNFFRATQSARVSLTRILTQVRRGTVSEKDPATGVDFTDNTATTNINVITDSGQDITYRFDSVNKRLLMITNSITTDPDYVLASNVTETKFQIEIGVDANNTKCVSRMSVSIVVKVGNNEVRLSGSAAPRMTMSY